MEIADNSLLILGGIALVAAMLMTSIRRLRVLVLLAGFLALAHFLFVDRVFLGGLLALLLIAATGFRLLVMLRRARNGSMLEDERELFDHVMRVEEPASQGRLRDLMTWRDVEPGDVLMRQDQAEPPLIYIARGAADITRGSNQVGTCGPGDFLGEMSAVFGHKASATVTASEPMRIAEFNRDGLGELVRGVPEIGTALDAALNRSLAAKVMRMNEAATAGGS